MPEKNKLKASINEIPTGPIEIPTPPETELEETKDIYAQTLEEEEKVKQPSETSEYVTYGDLKRYANVVFTAMGFTLVASLFALVLNGILIYKLIKLNEKVTQFKEVWGQTKNLLDETIGLVEDLEGQEITFTYHFSQTIPFEGDIPIQQKINFPFRGTVPINTVVEVPISIGFHTVKVSVPINTKVPVSTVIPIDINQTVHIKTKVPVQMDIPITLNLKDTPIKDLLTEIRQWLEKLRNFMNSLEKTLAY